MCQFQFRILIFGTNSIQSSAAWREIWPALLLFDGFKGPEKGRDHYRDDVCENAGNAVPFQHLELYGGPPLFLVRCVPSRTRATPRSAHQEY
jgi:hypothetical protein